MSTRTKALSVSPSASEATLTAAEKKLLAAAQRRAAAVARQMDDEQKRALTEELDAIAAWVQELRRSVR